MTEKLENKNDVLPEGMPYDLTMLLQIGHIFDSKFPSSQSKNLK